MNFVSTVGAFILALSMLLFVWNISQPAARARGGRQPLGRLDAGMGDHFAAAAAQLRPRAAGPQPPPPLGSRAPGEARLASRQDGEYGQCSNRASPEASRRPAQTGSGASRSSTTTWACCSSSPREAVFFALLILAFVYYQRNVCHRAGPTAAERAAMSR